MNADVRPLVPEELLAHATFVRALAARLLDRRDEVDDVEQDAWLATLRAPPRERASVRSWFGRVVSRLSIERRRTAESRERRERLAAPTEALVSTHELAAKNELLRLVADAVVALDDAHRAVILLRFYDGSPTSEVARRLGLPLETTRSRLKRALVLLREELDRRAKGGRQEWMAGLATILTPARPVPLLAASTATAKLLSAFVVVFLLAGGAWFVRSRRASRVAVPPAASPASLASGAATPVAAAPSAARVAEPPSSEAPAVAPPPAAAPPPAPAAASGRVVVTVVDRDGRVVPGRAQVNVNHPGSKDGGAAARALLDHDHPELEVAGAPVGEVDVDVTLDFRPNGSLHEKADVREGETTRVTLRYDGPDPATSICVRLDQAISNGQSIPRLIDERPVARFVAADGSPLAPDFVAGALPFLVAAPVGVGPYTLRIDDPRWQPLRVDGLHASDAIAVSLIGSAALHVVVRRSGDTPPVANAKFTFAHEESGIVFESSTPPATVNADGSVTFAGLEPDSFILVVHLEGNVSRRVPIPSLRSGETRDVEVLIDADSPIGRIEGVLYASDRRTPLANRSISLYAPAKLDDSPKSMWFFPLPPRTGESGGPQVSFGGGGVSDSMRLGKARATSDESGRFRFTGLPFGRWILRYSSEEGIETVLDDLVLDAEHPKREDVALVESEGATIVGRLVTSSAVDFTGLSIFAKLSPAQQMARMDRRFSKRGREFDASTLLDLVPIAADGSFRIGPLPPGPVDLRIRDDGPVTIQGENSDQTSYFGSGDGVELAKVELPSSGEKVVEIPADAFVPGEVRLTVVVDGEPLAGLVAAAVRAPGNSIDFPRGGKSDADGRVRLGPLLPGELRIAVGSPNSGWTQSEAAKVTLAPAGAVDQLVSIATFEGSVALLDASGQPLCERRLFIGSTIKYDLVVLWASVRTDAEGHLSLRLPAGRYVVSLTKDSEQTHAGPAHLDWTPDGPKQKELRVH